MLAIISPARNMRSSSPTSAQPDRPRFLAQTRQLLEALREYSPWELESLLDVNPQRAMEIYDRYQRFDPAAKGTPAIWAYYGAAFRNMNVQDFDSGDVCFAQKHLRILSALYGLLYPLDGILPYRLGMQGNFRIKGQNLYAFWKKRLYEELFSGNEPIVNLTSVEYAKLITPYLVPSDRWITCRFLLQKPDGVRGTVSTIRAARGQMARYLLKNRITEPEELKEFDWEGYRFDKSRSDDFTYTFVQQRC